MLAVLLLNGHGVLRVRLNRILAVYPVYRNTVFSASIRIELKPSVTPAILVTLPTLNSASG